MSHWYPLRVYFSGDQRILAVREAFQQLGIEVFVPMTYKEVTIKGNVHKELLPAINNIIFVKGNQTDISRQIEDADDTPAPIRHVSFMFRKTGVYKDASKIIDIPDVQMENFMQAVTGNEEYMIYLNKKDIDGKKSKPVVITGGRFNNVHGEMIRVDKNRHVVVRLQDFAIAAVTYIPLSQIRFVEE
jgi:transcription antitermination factor NusG